MKDTILDFPLNRIRRRPIRFISTSTGTEYIDDDRVKPGYEHIITRVAVENLTSAFTRFRIGVWDGANYQLSEEQKSPVAATLYWTSDPIYLSEGENLRIEKVGGAVSDVIMIYIDGFFRNISSGGA